MRPAAWQEARNLLCVRLDSIGDLLMTSPAIRALKAAGHRITLLTSPAGAEVARLIPEVGDVIAYEAPWMKATRKHSDTGSIFHNTLLTATSVARRSVSLRLERKRRAQAEAAVVGCGRNRRAGIAVVHCRHQVADGAADHETDDGVGGEVVTRIHAQESDQRGIENGPAPHGDLRIFVG